MARKVTTASHRPELVDRAPWRAAAQTWQAFVITALALVLGAPVLVVGVLLVVEAAISNAKPQLANRARPAPASAGWRTNAPQLLNFRPHVRSLNLRHA